MMNEVMSELVGQTIKEVYAQLPQGHFLKLVTSGGDTHYYSLEGDCCSESWLYAINGVEGLLDSQIQAVQPIEMPEPTDDRSRQEYDQLWCIRLVTNKGFCDIEFRNSSNGYYGGWLEEVPEDRVVEWEWQRGLADRRVEVEWTKITQSFTN